MKPPYLLLNPRQPWNGRVTESLTPTLNDVIAVDGDCHVYEVRREPAHSVVYALLPIPEDNVRQLLCAWTIYPLQTALEKGIDAPIDLQRYVIEIASASASRAMICLFELATACNSGRSGSLWLLDLGLEQLAAESIQYRKTPDDLTPPCILFHEREAASGISVCETVDDINTQLFSMPYFRLKANQPFANVVIDSKGNGWVVSSVRHTEQTTFIRRLFSSLLGLTCPVELICKPIKQLSLEVVRSYLTAGIFYNLILADTEFDAERENDGTHFRDIRAMTMALSEESTFAALFRKFAVWQEEIESPGLLKFLLAIE